MGHPYYISWSKQKNASEFEITGVDGVYVHSMKDGLPHNLIDMTSISYQGHFGHNPKMIINEITKQLQTIPMASPKGIYPHKDQTTLDLLKYMGTNFESGKIFYTTGGAETIENALKIARDITKKKIIFARKNSYHGATLGALTVTGDWRNPVHQTPENWVVRIPEPLEDPELIETKKIIDAHKESAAAIIIETITGGNGVIIPSKSWWKDLANYCQEKNILVIMDEVVCGFERTGKSFGYMHFDVIPDMVCLAKGITGGIIPFGALWTSKKISDHYEENVLVCGLTNYAHPLGLAALKGVLKLVKDPTFLENLRQSEKVFHAHLDELQKLPVVKAIRKIGMLSAVELHKTIEWKEFFNKGLYLVSQTNRIILAPPLIITKDELDSAFTKLQEVLKK